MPAPGAPMPSCPKRYVAARHCAVHKAEMCIDISEDAEYIEAAKVADFQAAKAEWIKQQKI